eukprot:TRINITY_DN3593_c0_g1_i1.p1 TRINITY_DN3593_c0_g1~~TRINITY_DN3593_c0_g1_i1.p1  ORF type:complete len:530 (-),score=175.08 TRINITY_DN3593_c0_g1_i1:52-1641(-)
MLTSIARQLQRPIIRANHVCVLTTRMIYSCNYSKLYSTRCTSTPLSTTTTTMFSPLQTKQYTTRNYASSANVDTSGGGVVSFKLADIGEGIAECEILKWMVKVGDTISEFDPICDVQSDKASVTIPSRFDGVVVKLYYGVGDMAKVGTPLVDIDLGGGSTTQISSSSPSSPTQPISSGSSISSPSTPSPSTSSSESTVREGPVLCTPAVRHIAKTKNIDLNKIIGTGKEGRILKEDIIAYEQQQKIQAQDPLLQPLLNQIPAELKPQITEQLQHAPSLAQQQQSIYTAPTKVTTGERERKVALSGIKRVMARTMTAASLVPHFGYCDEYSMDNLTLIRAMMKPIAEKQNVKLSYMPFFIKAASLALKMYPTLNSTINPDMTEITLKYYHNIGVAMDTPSGLLVPNIKDVQDKSIIEIAQELNRLHKAALNNQLTPADMTGGTFTLSNIGTIGGTYASPVLVIPEVAIGAIGKIQKTPRYNSKGEIIPVHLLQVSWSADHRVIDGATMANFSNAMKMFVEKPEAMLAELK